MSGGGPEYDYDPNSWSPLLVDHESDLIKTPEEQAIYDAKVKRGFISTYESDDDDMTAEEEAIYEAQVKESDGFDVQKTRVVYFCQIVPLNPELEEVVFYAKMAVDEFNKRVHKVTEGELEFHKVVMVMGKAINGIRYYITLDAKNLAKGGEIFTYQAVVFCGVDDDKVESFRCMPSGSKKDWFWVTHLCGCSEG